MTRPPYWKTAALTLITEYGSTLYIGIGRVPSIIDVWGCDRESFSSSLRNMHATLELTLTDVCSSRRCGHRALPVWLGGGGGPEAPPPISLSLKEEA